MPLDVFWTISDAMMSDKRQVGGDHYLSMNVGPWDVIDTWDINYQVGFYRGNALKYILRAGRKGDTVQDLQKAQHYIEKLIEVLNGRK